MPANTELSNVLNQAAVWQHLESQATQGATQEATPGTLTQISPSEHLAQSVNAIREFIHQHASPGAQKTKALRNVQEFAATQVRHKPTSPGQPMMNENRRNLHLIASQLNNPNIATQQKIGAVLALAEGLNVCTEGVTLNILNCACELVNQQKGLAGLVIQAKNKMIDQQLLQLVKHQDSRHLSAFQAKNYEIHHVQALKNHVAGQWGLAVIEDCYATKAYQTQAGPMAQALLEKTITPAALADVLADQLAEKLVEFTGNNPSNNLETGMPSEQLKTEPLRRLIQAEFGNSIELEHCLQFNEDYSQVQLQSREALALQVVQAFQKIGLVDSNANAKIVQSQPKLSTQKALEQVLHLQGNLAYKQYAAPSAETNSSHSLLLSNFWFGHYRVDRQEERKDEERRITST